MKLISAPTKTIEVLDCERIFQRLATIGPSSYAITNEQGRVLNVWVRRHTDYGLSQRQILDEGRVIGYVLSLTTNVKKRK